MEPPISPPFVTHRQPRWRRRWRHRPRFLFAVLIFAVVLAVALVARAMPVRAVLIAFDIAATVFLVSVAWMFERTGPDLMRRRARDEDGGHRGFLWSNVATSIIVLVALGLELHARGAGSLWQIILAAGSLLLSWLFLNTMFALHYAHRYYAPHDPACPRLQFPGTSEPDYWDFVYFAFTIGMTFQVSDVQIADRQLRRLALVHSIIAFFFNVIIIALTVNVVAGQAG